MISFARLQLCAADPALPRWWPAIWRREHMGDAGRPDPAWPGWRSRRRILRTKEPPGLVLVLDDLR